MPYDYLRKIVVIGFLGCGTGLMTLDCGSRLASVRVSQNAGGIDHPNLPDIFVEHAKECVAMDAPKMPPGHVVLNSTVKVNEDGRKEDVTIGGISEEASDLGACLRNALWDLPVAEQPFQEGVATLKYWREHASEGHDSLVQFIKVIPGVPIVEGELVLEAEGYTIVLPVTVKVVAKPEKWSDGDKRTMAQLGQIAIDSLGYEEIMRRAEQVGWVKTVRVEHAQSAAEKRFIADGVPPTSAVIDAAFTRVMTRAAPAALVASQADSPAPGFGDLVGLGILAGALLTVGGIVVYELVTAEDTSVATTPAPAPASAAQPNATTAPPPPPPPPPPPRKYPNQTCENDEMARLEGEMHTICDKEYAATCSGDLGNPKQKAKLDQIPCSKILLSLQQRKACLAARWKVQNECFGGKPDTKHKKPIDDHQRGIDNCEALKVLNCAKGHPMAGL